jgi:hypothetical protein
LHLGEGIVLYRTLLSAFHKAQNIFGYFIDGFFG